MKKKVLFIDRDGTLVIEPPIDYQLDSLEKLEFYPKVFRNLGFIRSKLDFEFVMVRMDWVLLLFRRKPSGLLTI